MLLIEFSLAGNLANGQDEKSDLVNLANPGCFPSVVLKFSK